MALRTIKKIPVMSYAVLRVVYDNEWQEYQVLTYIGGKKQTDIYHAMDKEDALGTAVAMHREITTKILDAMNKVP